MKKVFHNYNTRWRNFHKTVDQIVNQSTVVVNKKGDEFYRAYKDGLSEIKTIVQNAITNKRNLRFSGGRWSLTKVAFSDDYMVDISNLTRQARLYKKDLHPSCTIDSADIQLCQGGSKIKTISSKLFLRGKSLFTCGASNGQTISGAISTGTHGSNIEYGSIQEMVLGLHVVVGENKSYLIERSTKPITNEAYRKKINAELISDDDMFYAALVGLGTFGVTYGVLIQVTDLYLLRNYVKDIKLSEVLELLDNGLDFENSSFTIAQESGINPEHFKVMVDPYSKACKAEIMFRKPYKDTYISPIKNNQTYYTADILKVIADLTEDNPITTQAFVGMLRSRVFPKDQNGKDAILSHQFWDTSTAGDTFACAFAVPLDQSSIALNTLLELIKINVDIPAVLALRFVKGTKALMGFSQFKETCVIEIDGVRNSVIKNFITKIYGGFKRAGLEKFTFHWGKMNPYSKELIEEMYGDNFKLWKEKRKELLGLEALEVFCTGYSDTIGICEENSTLLEDPLIG